MWAAMVAMDCNGRMRSQESPLAKMLKKEWAGMTCNGRTFQELNPD